PNECVPPGSEDPRTATYCVLVRGPARNSAPPEVWSVGTDGAGAHAVYVAGQVFKASAHDPELAPDGRSAVFSKVDSDVPPNYPNDPAANTAHDILSVDVPRGGPRRVTG